MLSDLLLHLIYLHLYRLCSQHCCRHSWAWKWANHSYNPAPVFGSCVDGRMRGLECCSDVAGRRSLPVWRLFWRYQVWWSEIWSTGTRPMRCHMSTGFRIWSYYLEVEIKWWLENIQMIMAQLIMTRNGGIQNGVTGWQPNRWQGVRRRVRQDVTVELSKQVPVEGCEDEEEESWGMTHSSSNFNFKA